jgi:hypothetical protein
VSEIIGMVEDEIIIWFSLGSCKYGGILSASLVAVEDKPVESEDQDEVDNNVEHVSDSSWGNQKSHGP